VVSPKKNLFSQVIISIAFSGKVVANFVFFFLLADEGFSPEETFYC
jgi:hypothetical protein